EPVPLAVEESAAESEGVDHRAPAGSRAEEVPNSRAVSQSHRVGGRELRRGRGGADILSIAGVGARLNRISSACRCHHQPAPSQPCTSDDASDSTSAADSASYGRRRSTSRVGGQPYLQIASSLCFARYRQKDNPL